MPQVEVEFSLDANGMLNVSATDKATGKSQNIEIKGSSGLSDDEINRMKHEAEEHASEDKQKREVIEIRNRAEILVHSTRSSLEEHGDKVSQEARGEIESAISNLEEKVKGDDGNAIEAAMNQLETASAELGKAVYEATAQQATENSEAPESDAKKDDDVIDAEYEVKDD